jgi:hypothetical protein
MSASKNEYIYKLAIVLGVKAEDEDEAAEYASDFIIGLSQYTSSDDPDDDHYKIKKWNWMY